MTTHHAPVIWLTGLSGAGKTTIATFLQRAFTSRGIASELLDGDVVRSFSPAGYSRLERDAHVRRVGFLASRLSAHGITTICALISPYRDSRAWVREQCPVFLEVYVATALEHCERRDVKGLYASARRGDIQGFTGVDDPYEAPLEPELWIDTVHTPLRSSVASVLRLWSDAGFVTRVERRVPEPSVIIETSQEQRPRAQTQV